ncbi:bifunctional 5,10-methylene-tetrahydrofolate dehydrogenase/5,10-methylene-tetrahydrofolate cyclohydrolase, partial [bacterium]
MQTKAGIINGKEIAVGIRASLKIEVEGLKNAGGLVPGLAVVLVGENPASKVYVKNKTIACAEVGIKSFQHTLPRTTTEGALLGLIRELNSSKEVHGILVQLPLPEQINSELILEAISSAKDVDGFHPYNIGRLATGSPVLQPCTPLGIMHLIDSTGVEITGKDAVVIGRSNIVGKPVALMLIKRSATVTVCHSKTIDMAGKIASADIVVAAIGAPRFVKGEWIKQGAIVIDVGINRLPDGTLA